MKSRAITLYEPLALAIGKDTVKAVPVERIEIQSHHKPWPRYKVVVTLDNDREAAARVESKVAKRGGTVTPGMFIEPWDKRMERQTTIGRVRRAFEGIVDVSDYSDHPTSFIGLERAQIRALAARVCELTDIVEQSALTAADLPQAGWGVPDPDDPETADRVAEGYSTESDEALDSPE